MAPVLGLLLLVAVSTAARVSFRDHKLLRVPVTTREQANVIAQLEQMGVDVWSMVIGQEAHLHVSPNELKYVNSTLVKARMLAKVAVQDLQQLIDKEQESIRKADLKRAGGDWVGKSFVRYDEIEEWILSLPKLYPDKCAVEKIGKTYENRFIYNIKISNNIAESGNRSVIFTEANMHAREWLSHSALAHVVQRFVWEYSNHPRITWVMNTYELHFVYLSNPDGYEYTWTTNRLWRKTTTKYGNCIGVDPVRNFDHNHCGAGTSSDPCSDIYCGPTPFSERETAGLNHRLEAISHRLVAYQSVQSYAQVLSVPYAYKANTYPHDFREMMRVVDEMADEIYKTTRKVYSTGNAADMFNPAAGSPMDLVRDTYGTKYVLTWDLRPTSGDPNGYIVDPSQIEPTGDEILAGMLRLCETIRI